MSTKITQGPDEEYEEGAVCDIGWAIDAMEDFISTALDNNTSLDDFSTSVNTHFKDNPSIAAWLIGKYKERFEEKEKQQADMFATLKAVQAKLTKNGFFEE